MKHDKKAILFLVVLMIATLGAVGLVAVQGWKYLEDGVIESAQKEYDEYLVDKETKKEAAKDKEVDEKEATSDDEEDAYEIDMDLIADITMEELFNEIEGIEQIVSDKTITDVTVERESDRTNWKAPEERVFDYADVLTDEEEKKLREYIAGCEEECAMDIVIVILDEDMEASGLEWSDAMQSRAEDFYDDNYFGYNEIYGDGVLFLDNWYEDQAGSYIVTSGKQGDMFTSEDLDKIFDEVFAVINEDPCEAYRIFVEMVSEK